MQANITYGTYKAQQDKVLRVVGEILRAGGPRANPDPAIPAVGPVYPAATMPANLDIPQEYRRDLVRELNELIRRVNELSEALTGDPSA